jgi:hypothetical protein
VSPAEGEGGRQPRRPANVGNRRGDHGLEEPKGILEPKSAGRRRSLHRWLLFLVPLLVIATVAYRYHLTQMKKYPEIAEKGRTEGIPALEEGSFDKAYQLLSAAKTAVDQLGGAVTDADEIRNAAREAEIFIKLLSESLEELLAEAGRTDPLTWATRFDTYYKGRTILVDSWVTAKPGAGGSDRYDLLYRILPHGETRNFQEGGESRPDRIGAIDLTGFQLFELGDPAAGARVTFGAQLAGFKYDADRDLWVVQLEPKSGVIITHTKALEAMGWREGPSVVDPGEVKFPEDSE